MMHFEKQCTLFRNKSWLCAERMFVAQTEKTFAQHKHNFCVKKLEFAQVLTFAQTHYVCATVLTLCKRFDCCAEVRTSAHKWKFRAARISSRCDLELVSGAHVWCIFNGFASLIDLEGVGAKERRQTDQTNNSILFLIRRCGYSWCTWKNDRKR